jgi:uncharacterized membrane protein HdeD (DUF308 family)
MIQIIGLLLCVYLVFKGVEILQIALANPQADRWSLALGWLSLAAAGVLAVLFALWLIASGASMGNQMPRP